MSFSAQLVLDSIGRGKRLRVPHDKSQTARVVDPPQSPSFGQVPVARETVDELLASNLLFKLTEFQTGQRFGWRDMGFTDGTVADYYVMVQ